MREKRRTKKRFQHKWVENEEGEAVTRRQIEGCCAGFLYQWLGWRCPPTPLAPPLSSAARSIFWYILCDEQARLLGYRATTPYTRVLDQRSYEAGRREMNTDRYIANGGCLPAWIDDCCASYITLPQKNV